MKNDYILNPITLLDLDYGKKIDWEILESQNEWFHELRYVPQDSEWHGEGSVLNHTKMVVEELRALPRFKSFSHQYRLLLLWAALFHDVGKKYTTKTEIIDGRVRIISPGHANKSCKIFRTFIYKNNFLSPYYREVVCNLIQYHAFPIWALEAEDPKALKTLMKIQLTSSNSALSVLAEADMRGRFCKDRQEPLDKISLFREWIEEKNVGKKKNTFSFINSGSKMNFFNSPTPNPEYVSYNNFTCHVTLVCGLPGSGKDTYIEHFLRNAHSRGHYKVVSLDQIRKDNNFKPTKSKDTGRAVQLAMKQCKEYLAKGQDFFFNSTCITRDLRQKWVRLFMDYGAEVIIKYMETPYTTLIKRNKTRYKPIPEKVLEKLINKVEVPTKEEAHTVHVLTR